MNASNGFVTFFLAMILAMLCTITALQWRAICYLEELVIEKTTHVQKKYRLALLAHYVIQLVEHRFDDILAHIVHRGPLNVMLKPTQLFDKALVELTIAKNGDNSLGIKAEIGNAQLAGKRFEYILDAQLTVANGEPKKAFIVRNWGFEI